MDAVQGSGPIEAVRFRFPSSTGFPCDDLELGGFFVILEDILLVMERIFWVFEWEIQVEQGGYVVGWKERQTMKEGLGDAKKTLET